MYPQISRLMNCPGLIVSCLFAFLLSGSPLLCGSTAAIAVEKGSLPASELSNLETETDQLASRLDQRDARRRLIAIDDELSGHRDPEVSRLREKVLCLLARSLDKNAIQYIRTVFETDTEHRDEAAYALSLYAIQKPSDLAIWRFLIRSLTVVEGDQAVSVMKALTRYRQRATNPRWIRRIILIGLRLPESDQGVSIRLLQHCTNVRPAELLKMKAKATNCEILSAYQNWFRKKWPNELDPAWPKLPEKSRWRYEELKKKLAPLVFDKENVKRGKTVYQKAGCAKCHRKGDVGENLGPDLSDIAGLRQRKELLEAILFPNLELNEDYPSVTVLTTSGKTYSGLMSVGKAGVVQIIDSEGKKSSIEKGDIESISPSRQSNMPVGTLDPLSFQEICDLIAFVELRANSPQAYHRKEGP